MQKRLYLLCPTDYLEPIVNDTFRCANFFYYSLGTSFNLEDNTIACIKELVKKHHIQEISFVLSSNNHIVNDALGNQLFIKMRGLRSLYLQIAKQKKESELFWQTDCKEFSMLSYYLNDKIKELQCGLGKTENSSLEINGKIYDRAHHVFKNIYADLICMEKHSLN